MLGKQLAHLPAIIPIFGKETKHILEDEDGEIKAERKLNDIDKNLGLDRTTDATTNKDEESNLEENLLHDAEVDNSSRESIEEKLLKDAEKANIS